MADRRTILDAEQMQRVVRRMAGEIVDRNGGVEDLMFIGIRTRGVPLAESLAREIREMEGADIPRGVLDINLYRDDLSTVARYPVVKETRLPGTLDDRIVVLCDDVLFTGRTIRAALDALVDYGRPRSVRLAVLIDRGLRELPIQPDIVGRTVETARDELVEVRFAQTDGEDGVEVIPHDGSAAGPAAGAAEGD
ncbi:MAG: bifunctional pyr operon transcriptional regulator/uracil phosphoribosyltransferase PyrR [Acidobacteriota bacterium]|nr:bifunctional pyr operon transcriptional regulator/uracil phosphoribosyltransferase PyrR [Acidobacteriota bacterium]